MWSTGKKRRKKSPRKAPVRMGVLEITLVKKKDTKVESSPRLGGGGGGGGLGEVVGGWGEGGGGGGGGVLGGGGWGARSGAQDKSAVRKPPSKGK